MASASHSEEFTGHCPCRGISYTLLAAPIIIHCCHCTWCQRESGTAFAVNAIIETSKVQLSTASKGDATIQSISVPSASGKEQQIVRCSRCCVALWGHYAGYKEAAWVKVGTLERAGEVRPDVHIYTSTKVPWLDLSGGKVPVYAEYYKAAEVWDAEALERWKVVERMFQERKDREDNDSAILEAGS